MKKFKLRIGLREYVISENDQFKDDGENVRFLTQFMGWGSVLSDYLDPPILSQKALKEISKYKRKYLHDDPDTFSLEIPDCEIFRPCTWEKQLEIIKDIAELAYYGGGHDFKLGIFNWDKSAAKKTIDMKFEELKDNEK